MCGPRAPLALVGAALVLASMPAPAQRPNPILEPDQVWAFDGFAFKPPGGEGWFSLAKTRAGATIVKLTGSPTHALVLIVSAERRIGPPASPEALAEIVAARRAKLAQDPRVRLVADEVRLEDRDGARCSTYRVTADDARAPDAPFVVHVAGRACIHPAAQDLVVDVAVSERGRAEEFDDAARAASERLLDGVRLVPLGPSPELVDAEGLLRRGADAEAASALEPLAGRGEAFAALRLARLYDSGRGVAPDPARAERLYRIAADAGEPDALYNLGVFHEKARNGTRDASAAVRWFRRAADQRDAQAQLNLGLLYFKGDGVPRDHAQAREWLVLAAENGNERARELVRSLVFDPPPRAEPARPAVMVDPQ
jgi:hypothetical protein